MVQLHSVIIETQYGTCEIYLTKKQKEDIKCEASCIECDNRCEFGYQAVEVLII